MKTHSHLVKNTTKRKKLPTKPNLSNFNQMMKMFSMNKLKGVAIMDH